MEIQLLPGYAANLDDFFNSEGQRLKLDANLARVSIFGLMVLAYQRRMVVWMPYTKNKAAFKEINKIFIDKIKSTYINQRKYIIDDVIMQQAIDDFIYFVDDIHHKLQSKRRG